jgi:hypothetical protein
MGEAECSLVEFTLVHLSLALSVPRKRQESLAIVHDSLRHQGGVHAFQLDVRFREAFDCLVTLVGFQMLLALFECLKFCCKCSRQLFGKMIIAENFVLLQFQCGLLPCI